MKAKGLIFLLVVAIATLAAQSVYAGGLWGWKNSNEAEISRHEHQSRHSEQNPNGHYYPNGYYSPDVDLRDAHRAYWDEGLVDEIGKVITLPFTLPMRVKSEWERLNTKATHWKKAREAYEKGFPVQKEPPTAPTP